ncbi:MAG: IS1380 family transposase [Planctomycetota bacterium]
MVVEGPGRRETVVSFDADRISSDGGLFLLQELERRTGILRRASECFDDQRNPALIEHTACELVSQRILGIVLGYEDLIDHDSLRVDPLLASVVGKVDPMGKNRRVERDKGKALAGRNTLNRLELSASGGDGRYKKILLRDGAFDQFFLETFLASESPAPGGIIIDLDATNDPVHGEQEGRFFHGYYDEYCFLPLYAFCGDHLLLADLRTADQGPTVNLVSRLEMIVNGIREKWPEVQITFRGDAAFSVDELMSWCEENGHGYVFGLQKNSRLLKKIADELEEAKLEAEETGQASRVFKEFQYKTLDSWSRERRVIAKAEHLQGKSNPRFIVTNDFPDSHARALYEIVYCARGDMENRIKEQQLYLFADRTSCHELVANQLRLWLHSAAYVFMQAFRQLALEGTELERSHSHTIREKLFKIGALIKVTCRNIQVRLSESFPFKELLAAAWRNLATH